MTRHTRYFMAGSGAIMAAGLAAGLFAYYGGGFAALSASTGPDELNYVPADAAVIAYADVGAIMNSDLRNRIRQAVPSQPTGQEEFQRQTGIDIERDIQYVVAAVTPGSTGSGLLVARGNFNPTQLESFAVEQGGAVEHYREKRLISRSAIAEGHDGTLAFLEPGLVAIGDTRTVKRAIDAQMSASSVRSNDELMTLVAQMERGNNAWAVGRFDVLSSHANLPQQLTRQLPPVKWFAAAGHINGGVAGVLRVEATDEAAADLLRRQVSGAMAFGEMMGRSDPRISAALSSVQMSGSGRTVQLSFEVPAELLELLIPKQVGFSVERADLPPVPPAPPAPPVPPAPATP